MLHFYLGVYWPADRPLSLRHYADAARSFLAKLREMHPAFQSLAWVGDRPNSSIVLLPDLGNLDDLIYRHAGHTEAKYHNPNPDGTPSWESVGEFGYSMDFWTGRSARAGGISIALAAGYYGFLPVPNAVSVGFPPPGHECFPYPEFYQYQFLKGLFTEMIASWQPKYGRVTSHLFTDAVGAERPCVGWLTYLRDPRASGLRHHEMLRGLTFDETRDGGTLISLDTQIVSPDNHLQVAKARRLRNVLTAEKLD